MRERDLSDRGAAARSSGSEERSKLVDGGGRRGGEGAVGSRRGAGAATLDVGSRRGAASARSVVNSSAVGVDEAERSGCDDGVISPDVTDNFVAEAVHWCNYTLSSY